MTSQRAPPPNKRLERTAEKRGPLSRRPLGERSENAELSVWDISPLTY